MASAEKVICGKSWSSHDTVQGDQSNRLIADNTKYWASKIWRNEKENSVLNGWISRVKKILTYDFASYKNFSEMIKHENVNSHQVYISKRLCYKLNTTLKAINKPLENIIIMIRFILIAVALLPMRPLSKLVDFS